MSEETPPNSEVKAEVTIIIRALDGSFMAEVKAPVVTAWNIEDIYEEFPFLERPTRITAPHHKKTVFTFKPEHDPETMKLWHYTHYTRGWGRSEKE